MAHGSVRSAGTAQAGGNSPVGLLPETLLEELCDELLARGGRVWRRVASDSMAPLLRAGDRILVEPCTAEWVRWSDVIVFRSAAGPMVHRVLGVRRGSTPQLIEKGDANPFGGSIAPDAVIGRVCRRDREGRSVDLRRGRGRLIQMAMAALSLAELSVLLAGRVLRRALRADASTGLGRATTTWVHRGASWIARLLGPE